jgi:hypothetical protein
MGAARHRAAQPRAAEQLELATEGALQPGRPVAILYLVVHGAKAGPGVSSGK